MIKIAAVAILAVALVDAPPASANAGTVARVSSLSGNVLVSSDFNIATADVATRLAPGARVLVTANSSAIVEYDGGCQVRLAAGERLEVHADRSCAAIAASATPRAANNTEPRL